MCDFLTAVNVSYFPLGICTFFFKGIQELGVKIRTFLADTSGYFSQRSSVAFRWIEAVLLYRNIFTFAPSHFHPLLESTACVNSISGQRQC